VIIVGAGPTGLVLANLLGKTGRSVLLLEANCATVSEPRAVSIDDESLRVIQQIGLIDEVESEIVPGYGSEYLGPGRSIFLKVKPRAEPYGYPRRNAFRQPILEAQLRGGLSRFANVQTLFECRAESFVEEIDGVLLQLRRSDGTPEEVRCDYLVGCDGSSSTIRKALGYALAGSSLEERWLIIDLENAPADSPETVVYCDPRRPGIMLPGPRGTRRYEFKLLPGETDQALLADETIAQLLRTHGGSWESLVIRKAVYHFHARIADHWGRGRVWLAGDAAHLMPPFAGQGMNSGIRDAANLAWKLDAVLAGRIGRGLLETYECERRGHVKSMIQLALRMGTIFAPSSPLHGWAVRNSLRLLGLWPAAKSYFAEMKYKPAPRFDGGFLLRSQLSMRGIVGCLLPQPRLCNGLSGVKLDDALGHRFTLLGVDVDPTRLKNLTLGGRWDGLIDCRLALASNDVPDFKAHTGKLMLVRPDRYVMARFALEEGTHFASQIADLLASTWPSAGACATTSTSATAFHRSA